MKRISCILLCVILLIASSFAIADTREVGGDTVEEAVSRMQGFSLETQDDGAVTLSYAPELLENYLQSENHIAILPYTFASGDLSLYAMVFILTENKLERVEKVVIETDKKLYTITPGKPYTYNEKKRVGSVWIADENLTKVIEDMGTSEYISFDFIQDESIYSKIVLDEEQLYMMHQYFYVASTFLVKSDAATSGNTLLLSFLKGQSVFNYTVSTAEK